MNTPPDPTITGKHAKDAAWLVGTRFLTMAVGMIGLPILMSSLGMLQFGAWAVLLGGTFAFGTLELGMSAAVLRWSAMAATRNPEPGAGSISAIMTNALSSTAVVFSLGGVVLWMTADPLGDWLNLPDTLLLTPGQCILAVYVNVALTALLRSANVLLISSQFVLAYSRFTLIQALVTALATWAVAIHTRRLDLVIIVSSVASISVQTIAALGVTRKIPWAFRWQHLDPALMRRMLGHGSALQFSDLATFVVFQFDKLLISSVVTPAEVAHFEVASRTAQALGSFARTPFESIGPLMAARVGNDANLSRHAVRLTKLTLAGAGFFILLPLAVAPLGLFAWVGEIGYHAAEVFMLLALATVSTLLVLPFSICAQALGRTSLELRRATMAMVANVPLSFVLIRHYGKEGAALGTLLASLFANSLFTITMMRVLRISAMQLYSELRAILLPSIGVAFLTWCAAQLVEPWVIASRWYMAPTSALLVGAGAFALMIILLRNSALTPEEQQRILQVPVLGRVLAVLSPNRSRNLTSNKR